MRSQNLAQNPWINQDGNTSDLTLEEWRLALFHLHTWPPEMQQAITSLRQHFVLVPPPSGPGIDLTKLPISILEDPDALAALRIIREGPWFDLDGYPDFISQNELQAALKYSGQFEPSVQRGLLTLEHHFDSISPTVPDPRPRTTVASRFGAQVQVYPGSEHLLERLDSLFEVWRAPLPSATSSPKPPS